MRINNNIMALNAHRQLAVNHTNASEQSLQTYLRRGIDPTDYLTIKANFTPILREPYRIGVTENTTYKEVFNSDDSRWGGSGQTTHGLLQAKNPPWHNQPHSLELKLPPQGVVFLKGVEEE